MVWAIGQVDIVCKLGTQVLGSIGDAAIAAVEEMAKNQS